MEEMKVQSQVLTEAALMEADGATFPFEVRIKVGERERVFDIHGKNQKDVYVVTERID